MFRNTMIGLLKTRTTGMQGHMMMLLKSKESKEDTKIN